MFTKEAIQALQESEAISSAAAVIENSGDALNIAALPSDFSIHDLERYLPNRRRARGTMTTADVADFAVYVKAHAESNASVFVDASAMAANAVLNLGTAEAPGHADNRAVVTLQKTATYEAMRQIADGIGRKQADIAEFLEDWSEHIKCFDDAGPIDTPKGIAAIRKLTIEAMRKVESSAQNLSASQSAFESVSATSGAAPIPTIIYFTCVPYQGLESHQFVLRLGVLTGGDKPAVTLRLIKAELHAEWMAKEFAVLVGAALNKDSKVIPVLVGSYSIKA